MAWTVSHFAFAQDDDALDTNSASAESKIDLAYGVGDWIWTAQTHDQQTCRFWKRVAIPQNAQVTLAMLTVTADDGYRFYLDGREVGQGTQWKFFTEYDLTRILGPGSHILAAECFNEYLQAGLIGSLHVQMQDGKSIDVPTDRSWRIVPNDEKNWTTKWNAAPGWESAVVEAKFGDGPWRGRTVRILYPPPVQPVMVTFWQSGRFRILILSVCAVLAAFCAWLLGRLAVYAQAQQVVRCERARIARDIHDDLTAGLTQLVLFGEVFQNELAKGSEARRQAAKVCEKARSLSQSMNEVIWMVNSQRDTFRDFTSYVCKYAETFLSPTPIRCRFDVEEEMPELPCDLGVRRNIFLGVKEALNNALRHSGASELRLQIHCQGGQMVVSIADNGNGFDPALAMGRGNGLSNMIARGAEAGGVCRIVSRPGAGCRVEFAVPLARDTKPRLKFWKRRSPASIQMPSARPMKNAS